MKLKEEKKMHNMNDYDVMNLEEGIGIWDFHDENDFFDSYDPE